MSATAVAVPSEVEVLEETLKWFRARSHFTQDMYIELKPDAPDAAEGEAGPYVGATCAIGGVEHAIWRLTGKQVYGARGAVKATVPQTRKRDPMIRLYVKVMGRLNGMSKRLYDQPNIEQVTLLGADESEGRDAMRNVIRTALREARREAAV